MKGEMEKLLSCPFCGLGETQYSEQHLPPSMSGKPGALITARVQHWCEKVPGVVGAYFEFRGREKIDAITAWNRRASIAAKEG